MNLYEEKTAYQVVVDNMFAHIRQIYDLSI